MAERVFVDSDWLQTQHGAVLVHVGTTMGGQDPRAAYNDRHLDGAEFVSLDDDLADPPDGVRGRHPLPSPERFAAVLDRLGIDDDSLVVAYDDRGGAFAARLVWMLRILDVDARLLDIAPAAISARSGSESERANVASPAPAPERSARPWPAEAVASAAEVAVHIDAGGVVIDSREAPRYRGEVEPIDPVAGHVPGAINRFFGDNLDDGRLRSVEDLRDRFAVVADDPDAIVYCGSGVTACHNALAIEHAGLGRPRVYVGSWSGWSADPDRPIA